MDGSRVVGQENFLEEVISELHLDCGAKAQKSEIGNICRNAGLIWLEPRMYFGECKGVS